MIFTSHPNKTKLNLYLEFYIKPRIAELNYLEFLESIPDPPRGAGGDCLPKSLKFGQKVEFFGQRQEKFLS